jgi:hypothetical protein
MSFLRFLFLLFTICALLLAHQSSDHLIGLGENMRRNSEANLFGCFQIDGQLKPGWLLDREIGTVCTSCGNNLLLETGVGSQERLRFHSLRASVS